LKNLNSEVEGEVAIETEFGAIAHDVHQWLRGETLRRLVDQGEIMLQASVGYMFDPANAKDRCKGYWTVEHIY